MKALKLEAKPNFKRLTIFDENVFEIYVKRTKLVFNKPVFCGMSILDISEMLMCEFHHNLIKSKYGDRAKLLSTDTDGLA